MKKYIISLLIIFSTILVFPSDVLASVNSGFIPGQIWYSEEILKEGETVNIHTAVWNGEKNGISVKVEFYDKNILLGSRDVVLTPLELKDVYIPWKITTGDHLISAKITSSTSTISGKKETVVLGRIATSNDRQFVPVGASGNQGVLSSGTDALKTQVDKTASKIDSVIPEKIKTPILNGFALLDNLRDKTFTKITIAKDKTQKEVDLFKSEDKTIVETITEKSNIEDSTRKPIAYIKLFLLSALAFIFSSKIVFYGLLILIVFYIMRFIYRSIQNR